METQLTADERLHMQEQARKLRAIYIQMDAGMERLRLWRVAELLDSITRAWSVEGYTLTSEAKAVLAEYGIDAPPPIVKSIKRYRELTEEETGRLAGYQMSLRRELRKYPLEDLYLVDRLAMGKLVDAVETGRIKPESYRLIVHALRRHGIV